MALKLSPRDGRAERAAVAALVAQIPRFLRLLYRLLRDARVSRLDKALLLGVAAYVVMPLDLLPDVFGFLGLVDDLYFMALALERLLVRSGREVLLEHWEGDPETLDRLVLGLEEVGSFVPAPVRSVLRGRVRED